MNDIGVDEIYEAGEGIQGERRDLRATFTSFRISPLREFARKWIPDTHGVFVCEALLN